MSEPRTFLNERVVLHAGDCCEVLRSMADNSVDSVCTDPPYHLQSIVKRFAKVGRTDKTWSRSGPHQRTAAGFMNKQWDGGDIAFRSELWAEVLRVLKPGGYIMAFSGCRTYHRTACAIEDAGFITHPFFAWCFGSGFPKAHSASKQIDRAAGVERQIVGEKRAGIARKARNGGEMCGGEESFEHLRRADITAPTTAAAREWDGWFYGTQSLKPAVEPIYFGQKPFSEKTGAANVLRWGTGAINVGACRVPSGDDLTRECLGMASAENEGWRRPWMEKAEKQTFGSTDGRWPANLLHDGSEEVLACFPEDTTSGRLEPHHAPERKKGGNIYGKFNGLRCAAPPFGGDSGSAARFFASFPQDDDLTAPGMGALQAGSAMPRHAVNMQRIFYTGKANSDDRLGSKHPTVKPLDLIQYLVRLITPKNGVCLDHFAGTGTTGEACFREGFRAILIEREAEYLADIERRMSLVLEGPDTRAYASMKARNRPRDDGPLFDEAAK